MAQTPERRKEYRKEYYERVKNEDWFKQRKKERNARYREKHPYVRKKEFKNSYSKEYKRNYYQENRKKILAKARERYAEKKHKKEIAYIYTL